MKKRRAITSATSHGAMPQLPEELDGRTKGSIIAVWMTLMVVSLKVNVMTLYYF